ncbi:hypothetical protein [Methermicoccus shengliensis]|uniref:Uncharacterized protein n=1 Tax=Methermicoccus shengliensis TaxID=660064 RepID=A0A832RVT7_9EURY|nr:hypothetical protein [Methermicoccus shengliensis]KUK29947.1 MAG: hypothetical protein XD62_0950 [Methanosarcinales archeaon 56_1174]MDI3487999.1 hypothetical protein [Methanosarcinales archaeon]MDN5295595.1 hypothetical protein [Methanosarcinales archaeon]HIH70387.1 hypothetical protein [Methermicoccus shengliensis]
MRWVAVLITLVALVALGCVQPAQHPSEGTPASTTAVEGTDVEGTDLLIADAQLDMLEQKMTELEQVLSELENTSAMLETQ